MTEKIITYAEAEESNENIMEESRIEQAAPDMADTEEMPDEEDKPKTKRKTASKKKEAKKEVSPEESTVPEYVAESSAPEAEAVAEGEGEPGERRTSAEALKTVFIDLPQNNVEEQLRSNLDWRDVRAGARTGKLCTGTVAGVVKGEDGTELAMVSYKDYQVLIPPEEMIAQRELEFLKGDKRLLRNRMTLMLGAEIDFVIQAVDDESKTIIGSRRGGLYKKAELFYLTPGARQILPGRVAEARIVAVGYHSIRVEVFGVETVINYFNLSWAWAPDLKEKYAVSNRIFVRVNTISGSTPETLQITCDGRSVQSNPDIENLERCKIQSRYIGTVVNLRSGSITVRLNIGVNAVATGCMCEQLPGRGDEICFLVTSINREETVARGIVTRIIKKSS